MVVLAGGELSLPRDPSRHLPIESPRRLGQARLPGAGRKENGHQGAKLRKHLNSLTIDIIIILK